MVHFLSSTLSETLIKEFLILFFQFDYQLFTFRVISYF